MDDLQSTRRIAGELRSHVKNVNVVPEEKREYVIPAKTVVDWAFYGPCLACARDMEYHIWFQVRKKADVEDWLLKQFETKRRKAHLSLLEGRRQSGILIDRLEGIVCQSCRTTLAESRTKRETEKEQARKLKGEADKQAAARKLEQDLRDRERWNYHTAWRDAHPGEFDNLPDGFARFTVTTANRNYRVFFRWRPVGGKCRGDSPRNVVGLWVDRKFITHYYGWNIVPLEGERPYFKQDVQWIDGYEQDWPPNEDAAKQDLFGVGFCRWIERTFQPQLLRLKPAVKWTAKGTWPIDVNSLSVFVTPCVVHTHWIDGSAYARVLEDNEMPNVIEFADRALGLKITAR